MMVTQASSFKSPFVMSTKCSPAISFSLNISKCFSKLISFNQSHTSSTSQSSTAFCLKLYTAGSSYKSRVTQPSHDHHMTLHDHPMTSHVMGCHGIYTWLSEVICVNNPNGSNTTYAPIYLYHITYTHHATQLPHTCEWSPRVSASSASECWHTSSWKDVSPSRKTYKDCLYQDELEEAEV